MLCTLIQLGLASNETLWNTFNGDLKAQKYSELKQITPENVRGLEVAWKMHTSDVSTGEKGVPQTVWSATPIFANNMLYIGTPFYRIFALDPETGKVIWVFNPHASLKALTQPDLKTEALLIGRQSIDNQIKRAKRESILVR